MRTFLIAILIVLGTLNTYAQLSEKELDNVEFLQMEDGKGGMIYGFTRGDKMIGPSMSVHADGMKIYTYYDLEGIAQDVQVVEVPSTGVLLLTEMKDNQMHGNAFKMTGSNLDWAQTYKNGEIKKVMEVEYTTKSSNRENCLGNCINGFGMYQTSDKQIVLGYFWSMQPVSPVIHIFDGGDMYLGGMKKWEREGLGKYTFANDKSYYIGLWKKNKREGLGIWFNGDGSIYKKGYFKKDELIKNM